MENIENKEAAESEKETETENLETEFEEAKRNYASKFEPRKITKDLEVVYVKNADGSLSPQIRKVGADK